MAKYQLWVKKTNSKIAVPPLGDVTSLEIAICEFKLKILALGLRALKESSLEGFSFQPRDFSGSRPDFCPSLLTR